MLLRFAEAFRDVLLPFILGGSALLLLLLALLVAQRLLRAAAGWRQRILIARYGPIVAAALDGDAMALAAAAKVIPRRHRPLVGSLVLAPLYAVRGGHNTRAAELADDLQLTGRWRADLRSRHWWHRSEAALALGLLRDQAAVRALIELLDDEHEQVRAAAIDALGQIGDPSAIGPLLARMSDPTRHERVRLVQSLRSFGEGSTAALLEHGAGHPHDRALVATILSFVGGAAAGDPLLQWAGATDAPTRAAAWRALSAIGLDERAFYHALKALADDDAAVRAAAARALAQSGRSDAAPHLAGHLDDEWEVAAQSARALLRLGPDGHAALAARVRQGAGLGHDLAQQVLWEGGPR
ncbi:MAG: HEAT repeat domain-containing protein [Acidobacteriota bacterium]|nr:HEAT repeat domain-containing protein [Acidobacteriota bacterium]